MNNPSPTQAITQQDIDLLLKRLKDLREQIKAARGAIAPLEGNLKQANEEYMNFVGVALRHYLRLKTEIDNLRRLISQLNNDVEELGELEESQKGSADRRFGDALDRQVLEAIAKDTLLKHLKRVLDPIDDAELFADLQALCQDPTTSLAEVLEQSPELVWQVKPVQETYMEQYNRLQQWEQSLTRQLDSLNSVEDRLREVSHYSLWQQRQKGSEIWQKFLQQALEQQEDQNYELQAKLATLQQEWEQLRGTPI